MCQKLYSNNGSICTWEPKQPPSYRNDRKNKIKKIRRLSRSGDESAENVCLFFLFIVSIDRPSHDPWKWGCVVWAADLDSARADTNWPRSAMDVVVLVYGCLLRF
jgi:hypothetical protein